VDGDDTALVLTTSGTTSTPKVVPLTYDNLLVSAEEKIEFFNFTERDVDLIVTPMYKGTSINSMTATLLSRGRVVLSKGFNHNEFIRLLKNDDLTWFTASPAVLSSLVDHAKKHDLNLKANSLRFARSSGAPLKRNIKEGSVGISMGNDIRIEEGEILIRGRNVLSGYENNEEANDASFSGDWFHTGDMGHVDGDGYVFITGRIKEMINRGGEKISPYEVEDAIVLHEDIKDVAVFPYPNSYGSEDAGAVVVIKGDGKMDLGQLRKYLMGRVNPFKMPSLLYVVDEIPLSSSGKVQRKMLFEALNGDYPEVYSSSATDDSSEVGDTKDGEELNARQKVLVSIWKDILNVKSVTLVDDFFELGGDSLSAAALFSEIEERFKVQVSVTDLFEKGTIADLSEYIEGAVKKDDRLRFIIPVKTGSSKRNLFFIHSGDGEIVTYHSVAGFLKSRINQYGFLFTIGNDKWSYPVDFDQLSTKYIDEIQLLQPEGPYILCGTCRGGVLAYHVACRMKERGLQVSILAMFDPLMNKLRTDVKNREMLRKFKYAFIDFKDVGLKGFPLLLAKKVRSFMKVLYIKFSARLYDYFCTRKIYKYMNRISKEVILGKAKVLTELKHYDGKIYYFRPSKTGSESGFSIDYWTGMSKELEVVAFIGTHNHMTDSDSFHLAEKLDRLVNRVFYVDKVFTLDIVFGIITIFLLVEGTRRIIGPWLSALGILSILYAKYGYLIPGQEVSSLTSSPL
jgi:thioesterase domain-containing protein/acyl carrier protein